MDKQLETIMEHPKVKAGIRLADNFDELDLYVRKARTSIMKMYPDWEIVNVNKQEVKKMKAILKKLDKIVSVLNQMKEPPYDG